MRIKVPIDLLFYVNNGAEFLRRHIINSLLHHAIVRMLKLQLMLLASIFVGVYEIETRFHGDQSAYRVLALYCALGFWWMCKGFPMPKKRTLLIKDKALPYGEPRVRVGDYVTREGTDIHRVIKVDESGVLSSNKELMDPLTTITVVCVVAPKTGWTKVGKIEDNILRRYSKIHPNQEDLWPRLAVLNK